LICNLSNRGFMINSPEYIPVDSIVQLTVPGIGPCEASVIWSFCGDTGASFTHPIVSASEHLGQYIERGAERISAEGIFGLRANGSYEVAAEICDISTLGLKGRCAEPLTIGSLVCVDIPGIGPAEAEVKWQLAGQFGAMFLDPIDLRNCEWNAVKARFS
jgi:hypothetical protein